MKLIEIKGKIWELTKLWFESSEQIKTCKLSESEMNIRAVKHEHITLSGSNRMLDKGIIKANGFAIIEIIVNNWPRQQAYDIYYSTKGYYCKVGGKRIYLEDMV